MADINDVIDGLERCDELSGRKCGGCPYDYFCEEMDFWVLKADALEAIKKQQEEIESLRKQPQIVRCRDCKHVCLCDATEMMPDIPVYAKCTLTDETHDTDWYCADGERK